jgi:hypothetical protein
MGCGVFERKGNSIAFFGYNEYCKEKEILLPS